jgi:hypothetical protein
VRMSISFGDRWDGPGFAGGETFQSCLVGFRSPLVS